MSARRFGDRPGECHGGATLPAKRVPWAPRLPMRPDPTGRGPPLPLLPHPKHIAAYEATRAGSADRILRLAELESGRRIAMEAKQQRADLAAQDRKDRHAYLLVIAALGAGALLVAFGATVLGIAALVVGSTRLFFLTLTTGRRFPPRPRTTEPAPVPLPPDSRPPTPPREFIDATDLEAGITAGRDSTGSAGRGSAGSAGRDSAGSAGRDSAGSAGADAAEAPPPGLVRITVNGRPKVVSPGKMSFDELVALAFRDGGREEVYAFSVLVRHGSEAFDAGEFEGDDRFPIREGTVVVVTKTHQA